MWNTVKTYAPPAGLAYAGVSIARAVPVPGGLIGRVALGVIGAGVGVWLGMKLAK